MTASALLRGMNLLPPLLFSGIRIRQISNDFRAVDVELRERFYNKNYVGCHFGGSLFAMTDPFWMLMVMRNLDRSYTVWDRSADQQGLAHGRDPRREGLNLRFSGRVGDHSTKTPRRKLRGVLLFAASRSDLALCVGLIVDAFNRVLRNHDAIAAIVTPGFSTLVNI